MPRPSKTHRLEATQQQADEQDPDAMAPHLRLRSGLRPGLGAPQPTAYGGDTGQVAVRGSAR